MPFIGLTGGLGMGKTTVLRFFKISGAVTISADKLVQGILQNPKVIKKIVSAVGKDILINKSFINKKRLADVIFDNPQKRKSVEKIIHPVVFQSAKSIKSRILGKNKKAIVVFEVPLLFESGCGRIFDKIIVVFCKRSTAIKRLIIKQGYSRHDALRRINAQIPISKKKAFADYLINNNSSVKQTESRVRDIYKELTGNKKKLG